MYKWYCLASCTPVLFRMSPTVDRWLENKIPIKWNRALFFPDESIGYRVQWWLFYTSHCSNFCWVEVRRNEWHIFKLCVGASRVVFLFFLHKAWLISSTCAPYAIFIPKVLITKCYVNWRDNQVEWKHSSVNRVQRDRKKLNWAIIRITTF